MLISKRTHRPEEIAGGSDHSSILIGCDSHHGNQRYLTSAYKATHRSRCTGLLDCRQHPIPIELTSRIPITCLREDCEVHMSCRPAPSVHTAEPKMITPLYQFVFEMTKPEAIP
jgi:hypothetical protein